jgi:hypothetical protein
VCAERLEGAVMLRRRTAAFVGVAALVATSVMWLSTGPAYAGCEAGPGNGDARIRKGSGEYRGSGIYACEGQDQTVKKLNLTPGEKFRAEVRIRNDGNGPTSIRLQSEIESNDPAQFKLRFLRPNGTNITEKVLEDEFEYQSVAEDASTQRLQIVVKARDTAQPGDQIHLYLGGFLGDLPSFTRDVVLTSAVLPV